MRRIRAKSQLEEKAHAEQHQEEQGLHSGALGDQESANGGDCLLSGHYEHFPEVSVLGEATVEEANIGSHLPIFKYRSFLSEHQPRAEGQSNHPNDQSSCPNRSREGKVSPRPALLRKSFDKSGLSFNIHAVEELEDGLGYAWVNEENEDESSRATALSSGQRPSSGSVGLYFLNLKARPLNAS